MLHHVPPRFHVLLWKNGNFFLMKKVGGAIYSLKSGILNDFKHVKLEIDLHIRTNRTLYLLILEMGGFTFGKNIPGRVPD